MLQSGTKHFTVATAGHVDHGKTSLLKALTGYDPDRLKEEKERGMTTDLGFAHLKIGDDLVVGFIDVPGHGKFLKNMIAGVGGIDMALLVVAADEGVMPQTKQHANILSLIGVRSIIVCLTKVDLVDGKQIQIVRGQVENLVAAHKFELLDCVGVSSKTGVGLNELKSALSKSLVHSQMQRNDQTSDTNSAFLPIFLPIDRVFAKPGFGTVVTGTLVSGKIQVGDQVQIEPAGARARVRRLETFGQEVQAALAGQRLAVNLALRADGKDKEKLTRGHVLVGQKTTPTEKIIVELTGQSHEMLGYKPSDHVGEAVRVYHGTAECPGRLSWVEKLSADQNDGRAIAQIVLSVPLVAWPSDRVLVRFADDTIDGGSLLVSDRPRWLARGEISEFAAILLAEKWSEAIEWYLNASPQRILKAQSLEKFLAPKVLNQKIDELVACQAILHIDEYVASRQSANILWQGLEANLEKANSDKGLPSESLRSSTGLDRKAFQTFIDELQASGKILKESDKVRLPHQIISEEKRSEKSALAEKIQKELSNHLCLEVDELAKQCCCTVADARNALALLSESQKAFVVGYEFAATADSLNLVHREIAKLWQAKKDISPGDLRAALNTSRKYVMPLLAYFDDNQITRRLPSGRVLLRAP